MFAAAPPVRVPPFDTWNEINVVVAESAVIDVPPAIQNAAPRDGATLYIPVTVGAERIAIPSGQETHVVFPFA